MYKSRLQPKFPTRTNQNNMDQEFPYALSRLLTHNEKHAITVKINYAIHDNDVDSMNVVKTLHDLVDTIPFPVEVDASQEKKKLKTIIEIAHARGGECLGGGDDEKQARIDMINYKFDLSNDIDLMMFGIRKGTDSDVESDESE